MGELRFGLGFDSHRRDETRPLRLGGIAFDGEPGLAGRSDADVVCHALADALLGAAALGDLGVHFAEDDPTTAGMPGPELLARAVALLREAGFAPVSCDLVVLAAGPALAPRREEIRGSLSGVLGVPAERVSVKATRPEGMGLAADGAACLALAVVEAS